MLLFVVFCYISFATALPALKSELSAPEDNGLHINAVELSAGKEEPEILSPIPDPPELDPIGFLVVNDVKVEEIKDKDKGSYNEEEETSGLPYYEPETGNNGMETTNPEQTVSGNNQLSFINNIFPWLSNISWPPTFSMPSWSFPSLGIFNRQVVYADAPEPNYRYVIV